MKMKGSASTGTSHHCTYLKSLSNKVGGMLCCHISQNKYSRLDAKLEKKMVEVKRDLMGHNNFKSDMVKALNEASPLEKSPAHVTRTRFKEMDWDKNGMVSFREFLFAFINWIGIDTDEEMSPEQSSSKQ